MRATTILFINPKNRVIIPATIKISVPCKNVCLVIIMDLPSHELKCDLPCYIDLYAMRWAKHDKKDRKSTRLNSSHVAISYAVFCLKKKIKRRSRSAGRRNSHYRATALVLISAVNNAGSG